MEGLAARRRPAGDPARGPLPRWWEHAACLGSNLDWWFPPRGGNHTTEYHKAVAICETCPVKQDCLEDAMFHQDMWGIRGGLSERQRRRIRPSYPFTQKRWCLQCGWSFTATSRTKTYCSRTCVEERVMVNKGRKVDPRR